MRLMSHPDAEVRKRALLCVQKIMLPADKLSFLAAAGTGGGGGGPAGAGAAAAAGGP